MDDLRSIILPLQPPRRELFCTVEAGTIPSEFSPQPYSNGTFAAAWLCNARMGNSITDRLAFSP